MIWNASASLTRQVVGVQVLDAGVDGGREFGDAVLVVAAGDGARREGGEGGGCCEDEGDELDDEHLLFYFWWLLGWLLKSVEEWLLAFPILQSGPL